MRQGCLEGERIACSGGCKPDYRLWEAVDDCRKNYEGCRCRDRGHTFNNLGPSHPGQGLPMLLAHPMPCICPGGASCFGKGQEFS